MLSRTRRETSFEGTLVMGVLAMSFADEHWYTMHASRRMDLDGDIVHDRLVCEMDGMHGCTRVLHCQGCANTSHNAMVSRFEVWEMKEGYRGVRVFLRIV